MGGGASKPASSMATFLADVNAKSIEGMDPVTLTNTFAKYSEAVNRAKAVEKSLTGNTSLKAQSRLREARDLIASLDPWVSVMAHRIEKVEQQRIDNEKSAREQAEKDVEEQRKTKEANEALRALGLRPEFAVDLPGPAAALLLEKHKAGVVSEARLPSQMALVDRRADRADAKQEDAQAFTLEKMAKAQEYSKARMAQAAEQRRAIAAEAREAGVPMDKFSAIYREMDALAGQQDQLFGRAKDLWNMGRVGEAQAVLDTAQRMDGELNDMMAQVREARMSIGKSAAPAAKPWANDPEYLKLSPADKAEWDAMMAGGR